MMFEKGHKKLGGRVAGTPNKMSQDMILMLQETLQELGGKEYLKRVAETHPQAFLSLIGKTLPKDVTLDTKQGEEICLSIMGKSDRWTRELEEKLAQAEAKLKEFGVSLPQC